MKKITKLITLFLCCILNATGCTDKKDDSIATGKAGELSWVISEDSVLTISGKGDMPDYIDISHGIGTTPREYIYNAPWPSTITAVVINDGVTSIGGCAFLGCSRLTSVTISNSVTYIGESAFRECSGLTSITLPNSVTSIGVGAFTECSGLTSITIPNSVTSLGNSTFRKCSGLTSVTISNSLTSIDYGSFMYCTGLISVTIPNSVTYIGANAFASCSELLSVTVPSSVTEIDYNAFTYCSSLAEIINYREIPQNLSLPVFNFINDECILFVPSGSEDAYRAAERWEYFKTIKAIQ